MAIIKDHSVQLEAFWYIACSNLNLKNMKIEIPGILKHTSMVKILLNFIIDRIWCRDSKNMVLTSYCTWYMLLPSLSSEADFRSETAVVLYNLAYHTFNPLYRTCLRLKTRHAESSALKLNNILTFIVFFLIYPMSHLYALSVFKF
jgi:hypothetical protein